MNRHPRRIPIALSAVTVFVLSAGTWSAAASRAEAQGKEKIAPRPAAANPAHAEEEKAIRESGAAFLKAFNAGDAKAVAAMFVRDADYIDHDGQEFRGREAIEKEYALTFARQKGMTMEVTPESLRFLGKDVAIQNVVARVRPAPGERGTVSRCTVVLVKQDGKWLLESVRELPYQPSSNYEFLSDLEWLVGSWSAKTGDVTIEMKCDWTTNRDFLLRTHSVKSGGNTLSTATQVIGWDPLLAQVRSWTFDSDGGFGSELWVKDGKKWVLKAAGVRREGHRTNAKNILTQGDADAFTWQSQDRLLDGAKLPDTAEVKFARDRAKP